MMRRRAFYRGMGAAVIFAAAWATSIVVVRSQAQTNVAALPPAWVLPPQAQPPAAQTIALFAELRTRRPDAVSAADEALGTTRARTLALARAGTYRTLKVARYGAAFRTGQLRPIAAP